MESSFIQKFVFDKLPVRGAFVVLNDAWQTISAQKIYPDGVRRVIGELLAANILVTTNLKLNGKVIAQIQDNNKIDLIVSECSNDFKVRATAKFSSGVSKDNQLSYGDCLDSGRLVISIDSFTSVDIYQSIVALSGLNLADILDEYMLQSEQLKTCFILAYSNDKVVGFMMQQLPDVENHFLDDIERVFMLAKTLTENELLSDEVSLILHKLFKSDDVVLFEPHSVKFMCRCGRENVANMLRSLGKQEAESIIEEQGKIDVTCDFCNSSYTFNAFDIHNIFCSLDIDVESISGEVH